MRERHFHNTLIHTLSVFLVLVPLVSCSKPQISATQTEITGDDNETPVEHAVVQFDAREISPELKATTQEMSPDEARSILENNCSSCHLVQSLLQINKSQAEWEAALQQMKMMGVNLNDTERGILLNYLASLNTP